MLSLIGKAGVCFGILLAALSMTSGCSSVPKEEPVEITLMHGWGGTLETHKTMQSIYAGFSKENPDIILTCIPYSDSSIAVKRANDMLAVGKMPDIVSTNGLSYFVNHAVKLKKAMDLMPYIEKDPELKNLIHPSVFENWETSGAHLYTVPDALEVAGYWYNKEYMQEAGMTDESGEILKPQTWSDFLSMIGRLKSWTEQSGRDISVCGIDDVQLTEFLFSARLAGEGAGGYRMATFPSAPADAQILIPVMRDLSTIENASRKVGNIESARQDFCDGKSILYFNGIWESKAITDSAKIQSIGYNPYPFEEGKSLAYVSASSGYVLAKQSDQRKAEASIRFLKYMLSDKVQKELAVQTGQMPSNPNIEGEEVFKESPVLAGAIDKIYAAGVQINMIRAVWPEEKVSIIEKYIRQNKFAVEDIRQMTSELNQVR